MKNILIISLFCITNLFSQGTPTPSNLKQNIYFWYDKNGNRTKSQISIIDCQMFEWPLNEPEPIIGPGKRTIDTVIHSILSENIGVKFFPNPTQDIVNISINTNIDMEQGVLTVMDINGKILFVKENVKNKTGEYFSMMNFAKGIYFVRLKLNDSKVIV